ncbi:AbrB/MazE/SpoVT family DNA-binding domain-containing protein [Rhizobium sp. SGZ-381]|uniref:AbrB/MazE/SpoVT family DNA-binding domain-containing protein n=1 Tax=Rhizobium sp. SGZ-381 TaxID=3342800 RepID=UPI00366B0EF0
MSSWESVLSSKGQVTIPKEMRAALNLRPGDTLVYSLIDGEVVITPKNVDFTELVGYLGKAPGGLASLEEIDKAVLDAAGANALDLSHPGKDDVAA